MKTNRAEEKDKNDCKMMEALIENNKLKEVLSKFKQDTLYFRIKSRAWLMNLLKKIGLYNLIKSLIRRDA
jgi:hypothetical protein